MIPASSILPVWHPANEPKKN